MSQTNQTAAAEKLQQWDGCAYELWEHKELFCFPCAQKSHGWVSAVRTAEDFLPDIEPEKLVCDSCHRFLFHHKEPVSMGATTNQSNAIIPTIRRFINNA